MITLANIWAGVANDISLFEWAIEMWSSNSRDACSARLKENSESNYLVQTHACSVCTITLTISGVSSAEIYTSIQLTFSLHLNLAGCNKRCCNFSEFELHKSVYELRSHSSSCDKPCQGHFWTQFVFYNPTEEPWAIISAVTKLAASISRLSMVQHWLIQLPLNTKPVTNKIRFDSRKWYESIM